MTSIILLLLGMAVQSAPDPTSPIDSEDTSSRTKRRAERVMNAGLPFAEQQLAENGQFAPFGAVMLPEGLIQNVMANDQREQPPVEEIHEQLLNGLREGAESGAYEVVATFVMVDLRDPVDGKTSTAVHVALEHRDGYCVDVFYPTVMRGDMLVLGEAFARKRSGTFFDACN